MFVQWRNLSKNRRASGISPAIAQAVNMQPAADPNQQKSKRCESPSPRRQQNMGADNGKDGHRRQEKPVSQSVDQRKDLVEEHERQDDPRPNSQKVKKGRMTALAKSQERQQRKRQPKDFDAVYDYIAQFSCQLRRVQSAFLQRRDRPFSQRAVEIMRQVRQEYQGADSPSGDDTEPALDVRDIDQMAQAQANEDKQGEYVGVEQCGRRDDKGQPLPPSNRNF